MIGRDVIKDMSEVEKYFTVHNIIKQDYIDYLKLCMPLFSQADKKLKDEIFKSINELYFGPQQDTTKEDSKKTVSIMKQLESNIKRIKTFGATSIKTPDQANRALENMKTAL